MSRDRLTILILKDLSAGQKLAQVAHVAHQWAVDHPEAFHHWHKTSNTIIVRSVPDELTLHGILSEMAVSGYKVASFVETEYRGRGDMLTAVAVATEGFESLRKYPLA